MTQNHPTRRTVVKAGLALTAVGAASAVLPSHVRATPTKEAVMAFTLPDLPYAKDALEPHMSAKTFEFHHGKHHLAYVNKLNELVAGTELEGKTLEEATGVARQEDVRLYGHALHLYSQRRQMHLVMS
mgnify:CR=1 FL=1